MQGRGIQSPMQNAKNKKHERLLYPVSKMHYSPGGSTFDWSTMTEAFQAHDYRKIRLHGACSLFFLCSG
jgi:hypothetical protein